MVSDGCGLRGGTNALVFFAVGSDVLFHPGSLGLPRGRVDVVITHFSLRSFCVFLWWTWRIENLTAQWYLANHTDTIQSAIWENQTNKQLEKKKVLSAFLKQLNFRSYTRYKQCCRCVFLTRRNRNASTRQILHRFCVKERWLQNGPIRNKVPTSLHSAPVQF